MLVKRLVGKKDSLPCLGVITRLYVVIVIFIVFFFAVCYWDEGGDVYVTELGFVTQGEPVVGEVL